MDNVIDTSGEVACKRWKDLTPFEQGYIEALLQSFGPYYEARPRGADERPMLRSMIMNVRWARFSDLAPETLKRILEDCAEARADGPTMEALGDQGAELWRLRQLDLISSDDPQFPPLTPYLGDDGLIYLRGGGQ